MDLTKKEQVRETLAADNRELSAARLAAVQLTGSFVFPLVMNAVVDLDLLGIIKRKGGSGVSAAEIGSEIAEEARPGLADRLDRVLGLLASHSLLTCSLRPTGAGRSERVYGLTRVAESFVVGGDDQRLTMAVLPPLFFHPASMRFWPHTKAAILDGESLFKKANGMSLFEYMSVDSNYNDAFNQAMEGESTAIMEDLFNIYKGFEGLTSLVDVAGGTGKCLSMVVSKYPNIIRAINFDQPHVIEKAPSFPGVEHVGGDMFVSIPQAEAIMLKDTLHDWNDEDCVKILEKCYEALPKGGKVIVINLLMPEAPEPTIPSKVITQIDIFMLMLFESWERTQKQYEAMSRASGFSEFRVATEERALYAWAIMEFIK